jgi:UDP-N-acetylmuramate--alanine ligase
MKNFATRDALFASALVGTGDAFVSELDESDGSISLFSPTIAVLNNVSLDHKSMDELRALFSDFVGKAKVAVLNLDNAETAALAKRHDGKALTYSLSAGADFGGDDIAPKPFGVSFTAIDGGSGARANVALKMPGRHNVSNALAAIAAATAAGVALEVAAKALSSFEGVKRRLEFAGEAGGVVVIDDFGHNPDKIAASLKTLHEFPGRLLVMFQPHGFGPLKKMKEEFIACFAAELGRDDVLLMPEPVYFGGTVDRTVGSEDIVAGVVARGRTARAFSTRAECGDALLAEARTGDRIVVMGARDDTLSEFASDLVNRLGQRKN